MKHNLTRQIHADKFPGTGFDVLLYRPFDFAYLLLAGLLFIGINNYYAFRNKTSFFESLGLGLILLTVWFFVSFLAVGQLHIGLGGKL